MRDAGRDPFRILKSTRLGKVTQEQMNDIQKDTFISPDLTLTKNWENQIKIKAAQLATKTFGYGLPDPSSLAMTTVNTDSSATILQPAADEVYMIDGISIKETEGSTAGGYLFLTDGASQNIIWIDTSISANQIDVVTWSGNLFLTNDVYLGWINASGGLSIVVSYSKVVY